MNTKPAHTPLPWRVEGKRVFADYSIAKAYGTNAVADAAFIVRACNAHEELLAACKALENVFAATERANAGWRDFAVCNLQDALKQARAAIAKAEGQTQ